MTRVYLIRHGEPESGWGQGGDPDPGLSVRGRAQAEQARDALLALPAPLRPDRVVSSPLRRCRETAAPFAAALGLQPAIDDAVGEVPTPAGLPPANRPTWLRRAFEGRWSEIVGDRDYEAWRRAVTDAVRGHAGAAVFSHYVAINAVLSFIQDDERVIVARPDHASVHALELGPDGRLSLTDLGREAATQVL
jgi:broad specificity phosphatase PhoE